MTACQDGYVCTWARPGTQGAGTVTALGGPPGPATGELGSPTQSNQVSQECILNSKCILYTQYQVYTQHLMMYVHKHSLSPSLKTV